MLKLGTLPSVQPTMQSIPMACILGALCGVLGGFFVIVNTYVNMFRKIFITSKFVQPIECVVIAFFTVTFWFWTPYLANETCEST